tara:strand:+ start:198 stop:332 length:135 start_codon:yes stop_codon:yes gene_type:complete
MPASSSMCITLPAGAPIDCLGVNDEAVIPHADAEKVDEQKTKKD